MIKQYLLKTFNSLKIDFFYDKKMSRIRGAYLNNILVITDNSSLFDIVKKFSSLKTLTIINYVGNSDGKINNIVKIISKYFKKEFILILDGDPLPEKIEKLILLRYSSSSVLPIKRIKTLKIKSRTIVDSYIIKQSCFPMH
jgi:hypothetical protein